MADCVALLVNNCDIVSSGYQLVKQLLTETDRFWEL